MNTARATGPPEIALSVLGISHPVGQTLGRTQLGLLLLVSPAFTHAVAVTWQFTWGGMVSDGRTHVSASGC